MAIRAGEANPFHLPTNTVTNVTYNIPETLGIIFANPSAEATFTLPEIAVGNQLLCNGSNLTIINQSSHIINLVTQGAETLGTSGIPAGYTVHLTINELNNWSIVNLSESNTAPTGLGHPLEGWWVQKTHGIGLLAAGPYPLVHIDTTQYPYMAQGYPGTLLQYGSWGTMVGLPRQAISAEFAFPVPYTRINDTDYVDETDYGTGLKIQSDGTLLTQLNGTNNVTSEFRNIYIKFAGTPDIRPAALKDASRYPNCNNPQFMLQERIEALMTFQPVTSGMGATRFPGQAALRDRLNKILTTGLTNTAVEVVAVQTTSPYNYVRFSNVRLTTIYCNTDPMVVPGITVQLDGFADAILNGAFKVTFNQFARPSTSANYVSTARPYYSFTIALDSSALAADADGYYTGLIGGETAQSTLNRVTPLSEYIDVSVAFQDLTYYAVGLGTHSTDVIYINAVQTPINFTAPVALAGTSITGYYGRGTPGSLVPLIAPSTATVSIVATVPFDATTALTNAGAVSGNIALCQRGVVAFTTKIANCIAAGAVGVIIMNNVSGELIVSGISNTVTIPVVSINLSDGNIMLANIVGMTGNITTDYAGNNNQIPQLTWRAITADPASTTIGLRTYPPAGSSFVRGLSSTLFAGNSTNGTGMPINDRYLQPYGSYFPYDLLLNNYLDRALGTDVNCLWWRLTGAAQDLVQSEAGLVYYGDPDIGREFEGTTAPYGSVPVAAPGTLAWKMIGNTNTTFSTITGNNFYFGRYDPAYTTGENIGYVRAAHCTLTDPSGFMSLPNFVPVVATGSPRPNIEPTVGVYTAWVKYLKNTLGCTHVELDITANVGGLIDTPVAMANMFGGRRSGVRNILNASEMGGGVPQFATDFESIGDFVQSSDNSIKEFRPDLNVGYYGAGSVFDNCTVAIITDNRASSYGDFFPRCFRGDLLNGALGANTQCNIYGDIDGRLDGGQAGSYKWNGTTMTSGNIAPTNFASPVQKMAYENGLLAFKFVAEPAGVYPVNQGYWLKPSLGPNLGAGPWVNSWEQLGYLGIGCGLAAGTLPARLAGDARPDPTFPPASTAERANWRAPWHEEVTKILIAL
jgi:hypothetical protein